MKIGILGYGGVGKTTLFSALTGQMIPNPVRGERRRGTAEVIDRRLDHLRDVFHPRKFTRARFDVEDMPALPHGDVQGRGEVLASLREPEALMLVVGTFEQARMMMPDSLAHPEAQLQSVLDDLLLLDLEVLENRLERITERMQKKPGERSALEREHAFVAKLQSAVEAGEFESPPAHDPDEQRILGELRLFVHKPRTVVFNVDESLPLDGDEARNLARLHPFSAVLCAAVELEIARLEPEDRAAFLREYGLMEPASERLTRLAYEALDLVAFFTVGKDEVRAWSIRRGSDAVTAAGKIHTDLARGFIRAETVPYAQVAEVHDEREYKAAAQTELKGKDYIVQDGDILNIRSGV